MVSAPLNYVKHKTFEDKKDKLDILFLGTSRTHNGFSPTVFEKELQIFYCYGLPLKLHLKVWECINGL